MARRGGLGKGLGALIPPGTSLDSDTDTGGGLEELPTSAIKPNRFQPRGHFDEEALGALADSIREVGVLQPILVRPVDDGYELIAGERRWRAARRVGLQMIPALVRETDDATSVAARAGREPAPRRPQRARGGGRLPAAHRGLRAHPRGGRVAGREEPGERHQLAAPPPAPAVDPEAGAREPAEHGPGARAARHARPRVPGAARAPRRPGRPVGARGRGGHPRARAPTLDVPTRPRARPSRSRAAPGSARPACSSSRSCSAITSRRG